MSVRVLLSAVFGLALIFIGSGCGQRPEARVPKATVVRVFKTISKTIPDYELFTARTAAVKTVEIRARVTGYLTKINFVPGAEIEEDKSLFIIDPRPYKLKTAQTARDTIRVSFAMPGPNWRRRRLQMANRPKHHLLIGR
jgi:multidrug efflux pump subunit AcrA (membrane-fusion protein)